MNQFQLESNQAERVSNVFAAAIGNSQATLEKLSYSMNYVGPVANSLGWSLEEATGALSVLYNAGYDGSMAGTSLQGYAVQVNTQTVVVQDSDSILQWGKMEYRYSGSSLIQSYERAYEIGEILLGKLNQNNGNLKITWRGDPSLKLQDKFTATDRFGDNEEFVAEYNRYKFDGGLKQDTRGRLK